MGFYLALENNIGLKKLSGWILKVQIIATSLGGNQC